MSRANYIVKIIKNVYYISLYYENSINRKAINSEITSNLDKLILSKIDAKNLVKSIHLGFIDLINYISSSLFAELTQEQVANFKFACCAYIDEFMYNQIGEKQWAKFLMEDHFFGTKISGEKLIYDIVKFIEHHNQQEREYGIVYYYMLCTGYLGIYRQDVAKIRTIKSELMKVINSEILFGNGEGVEDIAPSINSSIISTKQIDNIKNYNQIYTRVLFLSVSVLMVIISIVIYKGMIILKIFNNAKL